MSTIRYLVAAGALLGALNPPAGYAQTPRSTNPLASEDYVLNRAQPDFTLVNLPTGMRLPRNKSAFRVTHRFLRPIASGDAGDFFEDFFGFDSGALIGLEYRFGILPGTQIGVNRTSEKTIQFFTQYDVWRPGQKGPFGIAAIASMDGTNNFRDSYSPAIGAIFSYLIGEEAAFYVEPIWVNNTADLPSELVDNNSTTIVGLGTRLRIRPSVYVVAEVVPRIEGHDPGVPSASIALEKRWGGHLFQINFSNSFGTTMANVARGGYTNDDWYIGFNITRKFYVTRPMPTR